LQFKKTLFITAAGHFFSDITNPPMKTLPAIFISLIALAASARAAGMDYKITKISPAFVPTPKVQYQGGQHPPVQGTQPQWLEIEVAFQSAIDFTEELTFKYYVWFEDKLLTGEVTHTNIAKGRELYSVMYLSPKSILKLTAKAPTVSTIQNVGVQILSKGQVVDELSVKPSKAQWWQSMQPVPGLVVNKNETPFAALNWDRYEDIKPAAH
jgi:hypothetical protein